MPRKRLLLLLFVVLSLSLMTYQSNRKHFLPFRFLNVMLNGFHEVGTSVEDFVASPFKRMLLREEENTRLRAELSKMIREEQEWREAVLQNKRFRELLSLKEKERRYVTTARVIARNMDQWSNTVVLDKGLSDGIEKDMIAVTDKGLVGKISGVSRSYSYLLFPSDINFSAAARLQESRIEGVVSGTGFRRCQLKYVPYEEEVKKGDIVITSGLDLLFPQGIPIGYVSKVNKKDIGMFQDVEVIPFTDDAKIEFVVIIKRE
jgi:rod shape-determining protein MreC